jgi:hypothetical protein
MSLTIIVVMMMTIMMTMSNDAMMVAMNTILELERSVRLSSTCCRCCCYCLSILSHGFAILRLFKDRRLSLRYHPINCMVCMHASYHDKIESVAVAVAQQIDEDGPVHHGHNHHLSCHYHLLSHRVHDHTHHHIHHLPYHTIPYHTIPYHTAQSTQR